MATKTLDASETNGGQPSNPVFAKATDELVFLKRHYPRTAGQTVNVFAVGSGFRVNIRVRQYSGVTELTMHPIILSRFVYVDRLSDGSPTIRHAARQ